MSARPGSWQDTSTLPRRHRGTSAIGKALQWRYRLFQRKRHAGFVLEHVGGRPLLVSPGVLNPVLMRTGAFFASQLRAALVPREAEVLDMGTGTGVCAICAGEHARRVVAVDINPLAVRCARVNVLMSGLEHRVEVLQGDLFTPLAGRRFDLVLFNPPFLQGVPRDDADRAWRATDVAERFAADLRRHLQPGGSALVLLSTFGGADAFIGQFRRRGFDLSVVSERRLLTETLAILRVTPPDPAGDP